MNSKRKFRKCGSCGVSFKTLRGLRVHKTAMHGGYYHNTGHPGPHKKNHKTPGLFKLMGIIQVLDRIKDVENKIKETNTVFKEHNRDIELVLIVKEGVQ